MKHDPIPPSRRDFLRTSVLAAGAVLAPCLHAFGAGTHAAGKPTYALTPADRELFTNVLAKLRGLLADAMEKSKVEYGDGLRLHTPDVSGKYRGIWPDDFLFSTLALREKPAVDTLNRTLAFLGDSMLDRRRRWLWCQRLPDGHGHARARHRMRARRQAVARLFLSQAASTTSPPTG